VQLKVPKRRRRDEPPATIDGVLVMRNGRPYDPAWDAWRPPRRWPGIALTAVALSGLTLALIYHFTPSRGHTNVTLPTVPGAKVEAPYQPPTDVLPSAVQNFSGTRAQSGLSLNTSGSLAIWNFHCLCRHNFAVSVYDAKGTLNAVPVNALGATTVSAATALLVGGPHFQRHGRRTVDDHLRRHGQDARARDAVHVPVDG
jgi:hypothetical protein